MIIFDVENCNGFSDTEHIYTEIIGHRHKFKNIKQLYHYWNIKSKDKNMLDFYRADAFRIRDEIKKQYPEEFI